MKKITCQEVLMEIFCERIKSLRNERRIYQREVAEYLGVTLRSYQSYESGQSEPNLERLRALADYFGVTTDYLLGRSDAR